MSNYHLLTKNKQQIKGSICDLPPCHICERILAIQQGQNPYYVTTLETGYVVLGDYQYFKGYTLFLYKDHKIELHELLTRERSKFLNEMAQVAYAVWKAFNPKKLNYELLGNTDRHLHWHIFPRHSNDLVPHQPVWVIKDSLRNKQSSAPSKKQLKTLKQKLLISLKEVIKNERS